MYMSTSHLASVYKYCMIVLVVSTLSSLYTRCWITQTYLVQVRTDSRTMGSIPPCSATMSCLGVESPRTLPSVSPCVHIGHQCICSRSKSRHTGSRTPRRVSISRTPSDCRHNCPFCEYMCTCQSGDDLPTITAYVSDACQVSGD
jgi:hypothetical protein